MLKSFKVSVSEKEIGYREFSLLHTKEIIFKCKEQCYCRNLRSLSFVYNTPIKKNLCLYMTNNCANRPFYPGPLLQFISRMLRVCLVNETIFFHLYTFHMHCWKDNIYLAHCWLADITLSEPSTFTSTPLILLSHLINAFIFSLIQLYPASLVTYGHLLISFYFND